MTRRIIEGNYARLEGLKNSLVEEKYNNIPKDHADDYSSILENLRNECDDGFLRFDLPSHTFNNHDDPMYQANKGPLRSKILQLISYLENVHNASNRLLK